MLVRAPLAAPDIFPSGGGEPSDRLLFTFLLGKVRILRPLILGAGVNATTDNDGTGSFDDSGGASATFSMLSMESLLFCLLAVEADLELSLISLELSSFIIVRLLEDLFILRL